MSQDEREQIASDRQALPDQMRRELIVSFFFGGLNIACSIIASIIMLSAVVMMHRLKKKNGFENKQFDDI